MRIYYDPQEQGWFHTQQGQKLTLGIEEGPLPVSEVPSPNSIPFEFKRRNENNLGPLVGILARRKENKLIVGDKGLVQGIQRELLTYGGAAILFAPEDLEENVLKGLLYVPNRDQWVQVVAPIPHVIYNRYPHRQTEQSDVFTKAREKLTEKGCRFFNPCFLNKYDLYTILSEDEWLRPLLPDTIGVKDHTSLQNFIGQHTGVYLKPADSGKGKGIFIAREKKDGSIFFRDYKKVTVFKDFQGFWNSQEKIFLKKDYIAQKEISPFLYNGKRYDFRVLVHFNGHDYEITGIGVRQSGKQNLTTHVPRGGAILPLHRVIRTKDEDFLKEVARRCGEILSLKLGFFGELSIDAGITIDDEYVIYEVNSKPMKFDEKEIEQSRIQKLTELFHQLFKGH